VSQKTGCLCGERDCGNAGKHPIGPLARHGLNDATVDPARINSWWRRYPPANVGIATGPSNLVVVDIDPRNGGDAKWAKLVARFGRRIGRTYRVRTGSGGMHYYFRAPRGIVIASCSNALGPGVDVKARGGYVIAPPSYHKSGNFYVTLGGKLAPLPKRLLALLLSQQPERRSETYADRASDPAAMRQTREELTRCLDGLRWRSGDRAVALCPAHDDGSPSLSIRVLPDGGILFHCFAGCRYGDIMDALRERRDRQATG
jgi:hypothetical protein